VISRDISQSCSEICSTVVKDLQYVVELRYLEYFEVYYAETVVETGNSSYQLENQIVHLLKDSPFAWPGAALSC